MSRKTRDLDAVTPGWRLLVHPNGAPVFSADGTMLDERGNRSIFDDVDEGGDDGETET
ncbi:MAG TPA: hypothetical protein VIJ94_11390 [Caulobacteraceae bacterium]